MSDLEGSNEAGTARERSNPLDKIVICRRLITHIYNCGYKSGHNDTVEGCYTDILEQDMDTYHDDDVETVLNEIQGLDT